MALSKHAEEISERRSSNGARVVYEYQFPYPDRDDVAPGGLFGFSSEKLAAIRAFVRRATEESEARLFREMTLVYRLNADRTQASPVGYITKGEAAKIAWVPGGILLDLDHLHGGILVAGDHLFISDTKLEYGLRKCGSDVTSGTLINGLIDERLAA